MKKRAIILHPAIAPYRVDFFNSLAKEFDASFYFEFDNALEQAFDQEKLRKRLCFAPHFLSSGFMGIKNLRLEVLTILWKNKADVVFVSEYKYKDGFSGNGHLFVIIDKEMNELVFIEYF